MQQRQVDRVRTDGLEAGQRGTGWAWWIGRRAQGGGRTPFLPFLPFFPFPSLPFPSLSSTPDVTMYIQPCLLFTFDFRI